MGNNVRLEENGKKARTIYKSPASICFPSCKLKRQHTTIFFCTPLLENDKPPSRFHVKKMAYRENPKRLLENFKGTFDTCVKTTSEPPWTIVDRLECDKCRGNIAITLSDNGSVTYTTDAGHKNKMSLPFDAVEGVWIIFELFRVSLRFVDESEPEGEAGSGASGDGHDQVESVSSKYDGLKNLQLQNPNNMQPYLALPVPSFEQGDGASSSTVDLPQEIRGIRIGINKIEKQMEDVKEVLRQSSRTPEPVSPGCKTEAPSSCLSKLNFRKNFTALLTDLNADDIIDYLFQESIINGNLFETMSNQSRTRRETNRALLMKLLNKEVDRALFETILTKSEQGHLIPLFFPDEPKSP